MLSREALFASLPLTERVDQVGLVVVPVEGSPLGELYKGTRADTRFILPVGNEITPDIENICYIANAKDELMQASPHDQVLDEVTDVAVRAVQNHIAFAKSVVAPAVEELVSKVTQSLAELTPSSLLGMEVIQREAPLPLSNSSFDNLVRKFEETPYDSPSLLMRLPDRTVAEILDLMKTSQSSIDKDIEQWAAAKGDSFFIEVWNNLFQQKQADLVETRPLKFRDWIDSREHGRDVALAVFLLSRKLLEDPIEGIEMPLSQYENLMADFRNQAGASLCREIDDLDRALKQGMLIHTTNGTNKIVVNANVYRKWIEDGGENEVLFGNMLTAPVLTVASDINERATEFAQAWARHLSYVSTAEENRRFHRIKELLRFHFASMMRDVSDEERATLGNVEIVIKNFGDMVEEIRDSEIENLFALCLKLICRARFSRTSAEQILGSIDRIKRANPQVDVREAAAMATITYIADWVASQFKVATN